MLWLLALKAKLSFILNSKLLYKLDLIALMSRESLRAIWEVPISLYILL